VRVSGVTPTAYNGDWEVSQLVGLNGFKAKIKSTPAAGSAFGAALRIDIFAEVAGLGDLSGMSVEPNLTDATTHDSPGGFEEQVATTIATGEVTFWLAFDPADSSQMAIQADDAARVSRNWKITPQSGASKRYRFAGVVSGFAPKAPIKGLLTADVKFTVSGEPVELPSA
jgi:hypothetical protein